MVTLSVGCLNVRGLSSMWKHTCFLDVVRSHKIDVMVATETKMDKLQAFSTLLNDYDKIMSPCQTRWKSGVVLFQKNMALQICTIFKDSESELVILDITLWGKTFKLIGIYASSTEGKRNYFYSHLENVLVTSKALVMLGHLNAILDARQDSVGSNCKYSNSRYVDLLKRFKLADRCRLDSPSVPKWTWSNYEGSIRSYIGRIIVNSRDKDSFSCTQFT